MSILAQILIVVSVCSLIFMLYYLCLSAEEAAMISLFILLIVGGVGLGTICNVFTWKTQIEVISGVEYARFSDRYILLYYDEESNKTIQTDILDIKNFKKLEQPGANFGLLKEYNHYGFVIDRKIVIKNKVEIEK